MLAFYRSQHDNQSWVAALTTILDTCALVIAVVDTDVRGARRSLTFAMARHAVVDMCNVLDREPRAEPARLSADDLVRLRDGLGTRDPMRCGLVPRLAELRAMYEPRCALSALLMPLPPWCPPARVHEDWAATSQANGEREDRILELHRHRCAA